MKAGFFICLFGAFYTIANAGNDPTVIPDSSKTYKIFTKTRLVKLIDSIFDLEEFSSRDVELLNYYSSILTSNNCDSIRLQKLDLKNLSIYTDSDEKSLFPPVNLSELPSEQTIIIENGYLSFYQAPIKGVVTSHYGWRDGRLHKGIDINLNKGDNVTAAFAGKVRVAKRQGGFGNVVIIIHPNGLETVYAHLSRLKVKEGEVVQSGQLIGLGGSTGHSSGSHLHFELRFYGYALNPAAIISFNEHKMLHHTITIKNNTQGLCAFPSNSEIHQVQKGDTWYHVAKSYGLTLKELMALNGVAKRQYLKVGQELRIN